MTGRRILGVAATLAAVCAGLAVHLLARDSTASDIAGDAVYVVAVWSALVAIAPRWPSWPVGALAVAWCVGVELFQLTGLPEAWGHEWLPLMFVFGTVFDARDLAVYAVTGIVITVTDVVLRRILRRRAGASAAL